MVSMKKRIVFHHTEVTVTKCDEATIYLLHSGANVGLASKVDSYVGIDRNQISVQVEWLT